LSKVNLIHSDCISAMKSLPQNSVDSIVTDPPYELGFMGKSWDNSGIANNVEMWAEALRVLKPGGHLLAFSGSRTYHRMVCAIEDAGFEIRDQIMWVYGSGFPKSLDVAKAIDKMAGVEFEAKPASGVGFMNSNDDGYNTTLNQLVQTGKSTDEANKWKGWGTALKPAHEPIVMARKPLVGTVANNVLTYGVGGINIDASRVDYVSEDDKDSAHQNALGMDRLKRDYGIELGSFEGGWKKKSPLLPSGRWPANFIHDNSDEVVQLFPDTKGEIRQPTGNKILNPKTGWNNNSMIDTTVRGFADSGSAARFFYCAKASKRDRNEGLDGFETKEKRYRATANGTGETSKGMERFTTQPVPNHHPTVKPTSLMQYLVRLVTPKDGVVLDPFMGSGSTGKACVYEGFNFIGIDQDLDYVNIAKARTEFAKDCKDSELPLF